jgi:hypothetical protein
LKVRLLEYRPPSAASRFPALVGDDGEEPGSEGAARPEIAQAAPGIQSGLLDDVLGLGAIMQHRESESGRQPDQGPHKILIGSLVAGPSSSDEFRFGYLLHSSVTLQ